MSTTTTTTTPEDEDARDIAWLQISAFMDRICHAMENHYISQLNWQCDVARKLGIAESTIAVERARCIDAWSQERERLCDELGPALYRLATDRLNPTDAGERECAAAEMRAFVQVFADRLTRELSKQG